MIKKTIIGAAVLMATFGATSLYAQDGQGKGPQGNPLASLELTEAQMEACMPKPEKPAERPAEGARPEPREKPDAAALAACLQENGSSVTEADIEAALEAGRPERPAQ